MKNSTTLKEGENLFGGIIRVVIVALVSVASVSALYYLNYRKGIIIEFKYSIVDWIAPITIAIMGFFFIFFLEIWLGAMIVEKIGECIANMDMTTDLDKIFRYVVFIIQKAFDNGLLIPVLSVWLSHRFEKTVEDFSLDYTDFYSETVSKVCFSIIVSTVCIKNFIILFPNYEDVSFLINRVLMWLITVIGTWAGFGFKCEGRIQKEKKKIRKSKFVSKDGKKSWIVIIATLIIMMILILCPNNVFENTNFITTVCWISGTIMGVGLTCLYILTRIFQPSKKQSIKAFRQAEKAYNKKKSISKRFGRMSYRMNNGKLEINKVNITYDSHESDDDFIRLFGEDRITFSSPKDALEHLKDKYDDQEKYIWDAFEKCAEERAKNMLNES